MRLNKINHKNILVRILKDIYTDISLGSILGFKGGTAVYFFYGLDRFSVDLDFDLLELKKEKQVFEKIINIVQKYGSIKDFANKKNTLFILLSYEDGIQNIKIEINKRSFASHYEIKNYLGISMLVMRKEDMFAHKLVAMLERKKIANRDIYDVYFFLNNNWEINKKIIEQRTGMSLVKYLKKSIQFVEEIPEHNILAGIGELVDDKKKVWIKSNLKQEVVFGLKLMLDNEKN